jgi:hypothetical protein
MKLVIVSLLAVPALALAQAAQPAAPAKDPARPAAAEPAKAEATAAAVADAKLGTGVVDREPQGIAESFTSDVGKVYCWTKVTGAEGTEITHAWFKGDEKMGEVKLAVKYPSTRTWSAKTIPADGKGDWRVDVVAADGTVLKSLSFKVE